MASCVSPTHATPSGVVDVHSMPITFVLFSDDGSRFVSCSVDRTAIVYKVGAGCTFQASRTLVGHKDSVTSAAFSPKDKHIVATSSQDKTGQRGNRMRVRARTEIPRQGWWWWGEPSSVLKSSTKLPLSTHNIFLIFIDPITSFMRTIIPLSQCDYGILRLEHTHTHYVATARVLPMLLSAPMAHLLCLQVKI